MGKRVVPEVVTYYCDGCGKESDHPFTACRVHLPDRDYQGNVVYGHTLEICQTCERVVRDALQKIREETGE